MRGSVLHEVRWLATDLIPSTRDVPLPWLASQCLGDREIGPKVNAYLLEWIGSAHPESLFARRSKKFRWLPGAPLLRFMIWSGYDGLLYFSEGEVAGHAFFQKRGDALHGFSTAVDPSQTGGGHSVIYMLDFVAYGASHPGIAAVRVGTGNTNASRRLLARVKAKEGTLGWRVTEDGWIHYSK